MADFGEGGGFNFGAMTPTQFGGGVSNYTPPTDILTQASNPTVGPLSSAATATPWYDSLIQRLGITGPQHNDIFGMSPNKFSAVFGQLATAIAPNSIGGRVGQLAAAIGQAKMLGDAAKEQDKVNKAFLQKILSTQGHNSLAGLMADPAFNTNSIVNNPFLSFLANKGEEGIMNSSPNEIGLGSVLAPKTGGV